MHHTHRQLKYGRIERERRFLLAAVPDVALDRRYRIEDTYISESRLRLRRMTEPDGTVHHKLARKLPEHEHGALVMGNLYLSVAEYALLGQLPGHALVKDRGYVGPWGIDAFRGPLDGLVLAEVECDDATVLAALVPPFPIVREVTGEAAYTGGSLCMQQTPP